MSLTAGALCEFNSVLEYIWLRVTALSSVKPLVQESNVVTVRPLRLSQKYKNGK